MNVHVHERAKKKILMPSQRAERTDMNNKYTFETVAVDPKGYFYFLGYKDIEADTVEEAIKIYNAARRSGYEFEVLTESTLVDGIGGKLYAHDAITSWINQKNGDEMYICVSQIAA